jgi:hypothetical protein
MNDEIDQVVKRTRQYWFTDGFVEISLGGIFIILGIYFYLQSALPPDSLLLFILQAGFVLVIFGAVFMGKYIVNRLKSRLTFPRTGYVAYQPATKKQRMLSVGIALTMAALIAALFLTTPISMNWIPAITGFVVAIVWLISASRVGLVRFYLLAVFSSVMGVGLSLSGLETYLSLSIYYAIIGLSLILSGALALSKYLRQLPAMNENNLA